MKRSARLLGALAAALLLSTPGARARGDTWPQFRGPNRNGQSAETGLLKSWPAGGPKRLWLSKVDLGAGNSSMSVTDDAIYTTGVAGANGYVFRIDLNGKLVWKAKYAPEWKKNFLFSRTTPTVDGGRLYVMSGLGRIACLDAAKGTENWAIDTKRIYGSQKITWGLAESPLICDDKVLCTPGGTKATIVALDKVTGKEAWTARVGTDTSAYCSPIRIKDVRKDLIVTMLGESVVGVRTADGKLLWQTPYTGPWDVHANSPTYHDGRIYVTSGYDTGGLMLELAPDGGSVKRLWTDKTLDTHHGGVLLIGGHLYGANWISNAKGEWVCLDWRTGKVRFTEKWQNKGNLIAADGMIYAYAESGAVGLIKPDPTGWKPVSEFRVKEGSGRHWAHMAIANGRLYLRHGGALMAYDIRAGK